MKKFTGLVVILIILVLGSQYGMGYLTEKKVKEDTVQTKNINHTITVQEGRGEIHKDKKSFCGTSKEEAAKLCQNWLSEQKTSLKEKLLTSHCEAPRYLYGKDEDGCLNHLARGEVSFPIKQRE